MRDKFGGDSVAIDPNQEQLNVVHKDDHRAVVVGISYGSVLIASAYPDSVDEDGYEYDTHVEIDSDALDSVIAALIDVKAKLSQ